MAKMTPSPQDQAEQTPELEQFLTYRMARVQSKLNAQASRILRETAGITLTQWRLIALIGVTGRTNAAHLSRVAAMDKGLISRNVKSLAELRLVLTQRDEIDSRSHHLTLTESGEALYRKILPRMQTRQKALRSRLTDAENTILFDILDKLEAASEDPSI